MTIDELYRKLLRIGRRANYRPEELRRKFLDALPLPWLEKAKDIDEYLLLDELAKKLYEIELCQIARQKRDRIPDPLVSQRASREIYEPLPISAPQQQLQAKALFKKPQQQNHSVRMDRIELKVDEIGQMTSQFRRMMLDNQSKKPLHEKTYVIPTYSKALVAKDPPKEEQNQISTDFSDNSEKDLKKSAKILKSGS
ncbi:39877_t:CDS:2 [Gigaspora margarita]|uniref:39877_t:CDS:1 n=1 Tax=Gigaspora margarita TaxID=4874 RepID=A0ABN7V456_GIGMA|nr:39877_t:CDS:2 [Gigaspora margarita]